LYVGTHTPLLIGIMPLQATDSTDYSLPIRRSQSLTLDAMMTVH